jgi:hypothetical protein
MTALLNIGWFLGFILSIATVFQLIGFAGLTRMFPEGQRAWHLPAQLASLAFFAAMILCNPFVTVSLAK